MAYDPRKWFSYSNLYDENPPAEQLQITSEGLASSVVVKEEENKNGDENHLKEEKDGYDPCTPSFGLVTEKGAPDPRNLDRYIATLQKLIRPLSPDYKRKLPYDVICQLAHSVLDGTVFEIAKGLQDIQSLTEKNLYDRRMKLVNEQRGVKSEMKKRHHKQLADAQNRPHQIVVLEKQHAEEKKVFRQQSERELAQLDQKLMLDIDQQVADQQATLQRAGLPFFFITNDPEDLKLQMIVLEFIMKLADI